MNFMFFSVRLEIQPETKNSAGKSFTEQEARSLLTSFCTITPRGVAPCWTQERTQGFDTPSLALLFRPDKFNDKEIIINTNIMLETKH